MVAGFCLVEKHPQINFAEDERDCSAEHPIDVLRCVQSPLAGDQILQLPGFTNLHPLPSECAGRFNDSTELERCTNSVRCFGMA